MVYCRVASADQKDDLARQKAAAEQFCVAAGKPIGAWLQDLGSGLNYQRQNFVVLLEMVERNAMSEIVIAHQDRLVLLGYERLEKFCRDHGTTLTMMNAEPLSPKKK